MAAGPRDRRAGYLWATLSALAAGAAALFLFAGCAAGPSVPEPPVPERRVPSIPRVERRALLAGRRVLIVPVANPDGTARGTRGNACGVDLNRNFPTDNFRASPGRGASPLSEPESRALFDLVVRHAPRRVVSIHQPLACLDHDGPGEALAHAMARECDLPVRKLGSRPGSFGSWVGLEFGRPIVTVELPRNAHRLPEDELWKRYGRMLLAAVAFKDEQFGSDPE